MENRESFEYTYSAPEQEEIRRIRGKYLPREESKLEQLRRLDAGVTRKANMVSIALGTISSLVMGVGMCCCLVWGTLPYVFVLGIIVGMIGIVGIAMAYPVYTKVLAQEKARVAPEILRLAEELSSGN